MTAFDGIAEHHGDEEWTTWKEKVFGALQEVAEFVARRRGGGEAEEVVRLFRGSFNLCIRVRFKDDGPDAIIRFPKPGHATFLDEKIENEVQALQFIRENTTIPVPRVISWGLSADSPGQLGPFIIMDYVEGTHLSDVLKDQEQEKDVLNQAIDDRSLDFIYDQIADYLLQLSRFNFSHIGAISAEQEDFDESLGTWPVTKRPLTYMMNELATTVAKYPLDEFPVGPFATTTDYFNYLSKERLTHLWTQRNLASNPEDCRRQYIARHMFAGLTSKYLTEDQGPFKLFCDDMRQANMLVDKDTLQITAVLDIEFTNSMPAQYCYDPPWWLLLVGPDMWLERGHTIDEFVSLYEPRLKQFLRAMKRAEEKSGSGASLSDGMEGSWNTKRFWFNYAGRKSYDVDALFYAQLDECGAGIDSLQRDARAALEPFVQFKMEQLKHYDEEWNELFK